MAFADEILTYCLKNGAAIASELVTEETRALALALKEYAARWKHGEALLKNPLLLERGEEQYQAKTAACPVLEAMMFAAPFIPENSVTHALYLLPSYDEADINRLQFIDRLMDKLAAQWAATQTLPPDRGGKTKWGNYTEGSHNRTLKLFLRREKLWKESRVDGWIVRNQRTLGEDLNGILQHWEKVRAGAERELSWSFSWPSDEEVAARRAADAIIERATPEELESLRGRSEMLTEALHSALYFKKGRPV